jgi:hypothetical protein
VTQQEGGGSEEQRVCAWCATPATSQAATCSSCGAALAQRESIGDVAIPGLTTVDAALQDYDKRPLRLRGPSPSQGMAPALIVGAMAGGPIGLAAIGGVAAVAAAELMGARRPGDPGSLEAVGRPSEVALQAIRHLEDQGGDAARPRAAEPRAASTEPSGVEGGGDIWRDLPPVERRFATEQEEDVPDGR